MSFGKLGVVAALGTACASGPPLLLGQPIKKEVAVVVHLSKAAAHGDEFGGTASMVDAVSEGLTERGVRNQVYAADDDHPPAPRIEIMVETWGIGKGEPDAAGSAATVAGAAAGVPIAGIVALPLITPTGDYRVVVRFYREGDSAPSCVREFSGSVETKSYEAGSSAGEHVGSNILNQALSAECITGIETGGATSTSGRQAPTR